MLKYPDNIDTRGVPWLLFKTHGPRKAGNSIQLQSTGESVALYIPIGFNISDSLTYETHAAGALGAILNAWQESDGNMSEDDVTRMALSMSGSAARDTATDSLSATVSPAVTGLTSVVTQRTRNPHEFMTFKSPTLRSFSLSFKFIPKNQGEADVVPKIIKFFRKAAYPSKAPDGYDYMFPDTFMISAGQTSTLIKMPEVACTGITTTYNPSSLSYFVHANLPSEIDLALTFQELLPLDRSMIEQGY